MLAALESSGMAVLPLGEMMLVAAAICALRHPKEDLVAAGIESNHGRVVGEFPQPLSGNTAGIFVRCEHRLFCHGSFDPRRLGIFRFRTERSVDQTGGDTIRHQSIGRYNAWATLA